MIEEQTKSYSKKQIYKTLHPWVKQWFDKQFDDFTPAQKKSIIDIHKNNNILISSPTGSGKTLTAFLSVISELTTLAEKDKLEDKVYCIYISPLKALDNGATWRMLYKRFFSNMRHAFAAGVSFKQDTKESVNIIAEVKPRELPFPTMDIARADVPSQRPPLHLYLKTNAIGWGMGVSNIAVEIDFGKRWSAQLPIYYSAVNYFTSTKLIFH